VLGVRTKSLAPVPGNGMEPDRAAAIYDRHAPGLYQQALLALDDQAMAEQVVCDVVVAECARFGTAEIDTAVAGRRLAMAAYWRCLELAGVRAQHVPAALRHARGHGSAGGAAARDRCLRERGALALVLFGGPGCYEALQEAAASSAELARTMNAALVRLTAAGWRSSPPPCSLSADDNAGRDAGARCP
jgi:hypothetical protein